MFIQLRTVGDDFSEAEKAQIAAAAKAMGFTPVQLEGMNALELNGKIDGLKRLKRVKKTQAVTDWIFGKGKAQPKTRGRGAVGGSRGGTRYQPPGQSPRPGPRITPGARPPMRAERLDPPAAKPRRAAPPGPSEADDGLPDTGPAALKAIMDEVRAADKPKEPESKDGFGVKIFFLVAVLIVLVVTMMMPFIL